MPPALAKAELRELDAHFNPKSNTDHMTKVQFNPDSLKVSFSNSLKTNEGGDQNGPQAIQFAGAGTTKLSVTLYFDVTAALPAELPQVNDVRKLTQRVAYFITAAKTGSGRSTQYVPPGTRFIWGSFQFDGVMESMEETLEMFSADGRPLRASVAIALTRQEITEFAIKDIPEAESKAILEFLYAHCARPHWQVRFRWQADSVAFWDNRCVQHIAMWDYFPQVRSGFRVTVKGDKPFHRAN